MTINMQGAVFEMEEGVWEKLKAYMESIKRSVGTAGNGYEISVDIENRIAEILNERTGPAKRKLTIEDIDAVISSMGQPRDFVETEDLPVENTLNENPPRKRLVRGPDDKILGGVCSGIAAYFNIDPIFIRVLFAIAVLFSGAGIILYLVLWAMMPEGGTTKTKEQLEREKLKRSKWVWLLLWTMLLGVVSPIVICLIESTLLHHPFGISFVEVAFFSIGVGVILYFVFWIIMPEGGTTKTKEQSEQEKLKRRKWVRLLLWTVLLGAVLLFILELLRHLLIRY